MRRTKEIRGYVCQIGYNVFRNSKHEPSTGVFEMICDDGVRRIIYHDIDRLRGYQVAQDIEIGSLVSCIVRPKNKVDEPYHRRYGLVSVRISDYKAKRATNKYGYHHSHVLTTYNYVDGELCEPHAMSLAAFVMKMEDSYYIDMNAMISYDPRLYDMFINFNFDDMRDIQKAALAKSVGCLKYIDDEYRLNIAIQNEIDFRNSNPVWNGTEFGQDWRYEK